MATLRERAWNLGRWPRLTGWQLLQTPSIAALSDHVANRRIWAALVRRRPSMAFLVLATCVCCLFLEVVRWLGESFFYQGELVGRTASNLIADARGVSLAARDWPLSEPHHETA